MRDRRGAGQGQTRNDGQNGGEGHRRQEAEQHVAADGLGQVHGDHVAAADDLAADHATFEELGVLADDNHRAQAHQKDHVEEEADEAGSVEHRFARFLGVADGEEAHQDVRQTGGTEHQAETEGDCRDRIGQQAARGHQLGTELVHGFHLLEQRRQRKPELPVCQEQCQRTAEEQHAGLDDLYPGRRDHTAEGDVDHHQDADHEDRDVVVETEEQLDQLPGTDHLRDQVEDDHHQRRNRGHRPHLALVKPIRGNVGKGETAQVAQALGHQEQDDRPAGEEGQHVDIAVVARGVGHRRQPEQGCRRHVVAGDRQPVLETGDAAASGIKVGSGLGAAGRPVGDAHGHRDEDQEHDDRVPVGGLLGAGCIHRRPGKSQAGEEEQGDRRGQSMHHSFSF